MLRQNEIQPSRRPSGSTSSLACARLIRLRLGEKTRGVIELGFANPETPRLADADVLCLELSERLGNCIRQVARGRKERPSKRSLARNVTTFAILAIGGELAGIESELCQAGMELVNAHPALLLTWHSEAERFDARAEFGAAERQARSVILRDAVRTGRSCSGRLTVNDFALPQWPS